MTGPCALPARHCRATPARWTCCAVPEVRHDDLLALGDETLPEFAAAQSAAGALGARRSLAGGGALCRSRCALNYAIYIERQQWDIERTHKHESLRLPEDLDYARLGGLSIEVRQKFADARAPRRSAGRRACRA